MSTFYSDGFQDAVNYRGEIPPDPVRRNDGEISTCYRDEYLDGFRAGQRRLQADKSGAKWREVNRHLFV